MGKRTAAEVLLLDKILNAEAAVKCGFANGIIPSLQDEPEWFNIGIVPALVQLSKTDLKTLQNCKKLVDAAKDNNKIMQTI